MRVSPIYPARVLSMSAWPVGVVESVMVQENSWPRL